MDKRITKNSDKDKPSWDWTQVQCSLKINQASKKSVVWNLAPTIILTNPTSEYSDPNVRLYIDTEKSLQYSPELGWNWHKSWNLPNISLRLEAQMFAVKKNCDNDRTEHMSLIDVGIRGDGKMEMIDGQVYFSAMKFSSTTYNNEGMNFNLLIVLYINEDNNQKPKILTAVMSPGIFVDSRRSARDYQEKKFNSFIEPFLYENLEKEYIKRENKSKTESQIIIKNDPEGFYNYLTAPNIRHKVKHPVFLAIKFSNCVQILYNSDLLENMNFEEEKVMESIETMENSAIGILYERKDLGTNFQSIGQPEALIKAYRQSYENLLEQCKKYEPSDSQEQSSEQEEEEPSERSIKKVKLDQYPKNITRGSISNGKKPQTISYEKGFLKKEEQDHNLEEPKFFPPSLNEIGSKKGSAFNRAVGFKTITPQNQENLINKVNDIGQYQGSKLVQPLRISQGFTISQNQQNPNVNSQGEGKNLDGLVNNNLMLSSWLNNVKNNNVNLYDSLTGNNVAQHLLNQNGLDRFGNRTDQRNSQNPYQVNEQLQCLMQQVNLYRQLLAQITYQNALLGGRTYPQSGSGQTNQPQGTMNYPPEMIHNMLASMSALGSVGGLGLPQFQGLAGMGGLQGLAGLNLSAMGAGGAIPNLGGQGLNPSSLGTQGFAPQGLGVNNGLGGMLPNMQSLQALQALQNLGNFPNNSGGLMAPGGLGGLQNPQMPGNMNMNELLRNQMQQAKQQQKRNRDDSK